MPRLQVFVASLSNSEQIMGQCINYRTLPQITRQMKTISQIIGQYFKLWDSTSNYGTVSKITRHYLKLRDSTSNYGTVLQPTGRWFKVRNNS